MFLKNKNSRLPQRHFESYLYVKRTSQLIAALSLHGLNLCVMESVESQMLHFTVVLIVNRKYAGMNNS